MAERRTIAVIEAELESANQRLAAALAPIEDFNDARLEPLLVAAHNAAEEAGHCEEYDEILESIGAPGRSYQWTVPIVVEIKGLSSEGAAQVINEMLRNAQRRGEIGDYEAVAENELERK